MFLRYKIHKQNMCEVKVTLTFDHQLFYKLK